MWELLVIGYFSRCPPLGTACEVSDWCQLRQGISNALDWSAAGGVGERNPSISNAWGMSWIALPQELSMCCR
jgi:hypothetical protein